MRKKTNGDANGRWHVCVIFQLRSEYKRLGFWRIQVMDIVFDDYSSVLAASVYLNPCRITSHAMIFNIISVKLHISDNTLKIIVCHVLDSEEKEVIHLTLDKLNFHEIIWINSCLHINQFFTHKCHWQFKSYLVENKTLAILHIWPLMPWWRKESGH